ncbi:MAG: DUF5818 domain-containing protein [Nannocystaceae bacterium]|nr:hypothetical protein [Myxococcales bacterium]
MAKFTGTVRHNSLEGGFYELHTDNGEVFRLSSCDVKAGVRVVVDGSVEKGGFGIHMSGPSIKVNRITPA